ncbi:MAG: PKD domain-containing protein [Methanobacteriota archaeon]|nr:MAG: PKD domain-containing protein [Euryarchaeota archaeon]
MTRGRLERMRVGTFVVCVSLLIMNFQPPIEPFRNTDGPTFPVEVSTDKFYYELGEEVDIVLTNVGDEIVSYPVPPDLYIIDNVLRIVVDTKYCSKYQYEVRLSPGMNYSSKWRQVYLICREDGFRLPPSGEQVPSGQYSLCVGADFASYGNRTMSLWDCVGIGIRSGNETPNADAGPDQTVYEGDTVYFDGSGSKASVGVPISLGDNIMVNEVRPYEGVGGGSQVIFDSHGNLHITWNDMSREGGIYFDKAPFQGEFGTDVKVGEVGSVSSDIALGPDGSIHIAWWWGDVQYSVSTDDGLTFSSPVAINDENTPPGFGVSMAAGTNSDLHVVWFDPHSDRICYRSSLDGGKNWEPGLVVAEGYDPDIAASGDGSVYAVWNAMSNKSLNGTILFSRKAKSGPFEPAIQVHPMGDFPRAYPSIAMGANGDILIVWVEFDEDEHRIVLARSVDGGMSFEGPIVVRSVQLVDHFHTMRLGSPAVTGFGTSGVAVAWKDVPVWGGPARINASVSFDGGRTFGSHRAVDDSEWTRKTRTAIAGDAQGHIFVSWFDCRHCPAPGLIGSDIYGVWLGVSPAPLSFEWDFGDGSPPANVSNPTHVYGSQGIYEVTLVVEDEQGRKGFDNCTITVLEGNLPPVADAGPDQTVNEGDTVLFDGSGSYDPDGGGTGSWTRRTDDPTPRSAGGSATLNDEIYYIGGDSSDMIIAPSAISRKYNPATDSWSDLPDLPAPRVDIGVAVANGKIYAIGGNDGNDSTDTTFEFDPLASSWVAKAPLPIPMEAFGTAVVDDLVYVMGGSSTLIDCYPCGSVYEYDPVADSWSVKPDMPTGRADLAATVLDGEIYALGGDSRGSIGVVEVYDPVSEVWSSRTNMTIARSGLSAEVLDGNIYAFGGTETWSLPTNITETYNPFDDSWTFASSMLEDRVHSGSGAVGNCIYAIGGVYRGFLGLIPNSTEAYCLGREPKYEWDLEYDGIAFSTDATGPFANHTWFDDYSGDVALRVMDNYGAWDIDVAEVTVRNVPPTAEAGEDKVGYEVSTFTFDGSHSDPGIYDTHTYEWDFDYDGINFDVDAIGQSVTNTWIDDFDGEVALRVTDDDGGVGLDTAHVLVRNVPPTVELKVLPIEVDVSLRIAGEKWHDVSVELYEDDVLLAEGSLTRYPGSPNDQMLTLAHLGVDISRKYSAFVHYTPEDDPVNGQPNGANPCWIILRFDEGEELWLHHTFNVRHPETYTWEADLTAAILSHGLTFEASAYDPGADDLTFYWDFGDGTTSTTSFPNPSGLHPVDASETITHVFPGSGTYTITLTVMDDDGGSGVAAISITIP